MGPALGCCSHGVSQIHVTVAGLGAAAVVVTVSAQSAWSAVSLASQRRQFPAPPGVLMQPRANALRDRR